MEDMERGMLIFSQRESLGKRAWQKCKKKKQKE